MSPIVVSGEGMVVRIVTTVQAVKVVSGGLRGPKGNKGDPGTSSTGKRWYGNGPPGTIVGSSPGDEYIDGITGTLYVLT